MPYYSQFWGIFVRDDIAKEFQRPDGTIHDSLAGLHELYAQETEALYEVAELERRQKTRGYLTQRDWEECKRNHEVPK